MTTNTKCVLDKEGGQELFDNVTDEELIYLWRCIKGRGVPANEAWNVVLSRLALDMAFVQHRQFCCSKHGSALSDIVGSHYNRAYTEKHIPGGR